MSNEKITRICEQCGREFQVNPSQLKKTPCRFCSKDCRLQFQSAERTTNAQNSQNILKRFEKKILKTDGCWLWQSTIVKPGGYGQFFIYGKQEYAHRLSYLFYKGIDPAEQLVRHTCDNPPCVNPDHLILGSHQDNRDDCVTKLRHNFCENNHKAKLTKEQVKAILSDHRSQSAIATDFGIDQTTVSNIKTGKTWRLIDQK